MSAPIPIDKLLSAQSMIRDEAPPLIYYVGGTGTETIVILNAYGQSLAFWIPLINEIARRYRILIWQPKGSSSEHGGTCCAYPVEEHIADMHAIFQQEKIVKAHLLGWCTGPKTALAYYADFPEQIASMIFLTGCFIQPTQPKSLHTRYEATMNDLCRMIDRRPQVVNQLTEMMKKVLFEEKNSDNNQIAPPVTATREEIKQLVQQPFQTPESVLHYARQLIQFWDYEVTHILPTVTVPTLFIGGEKDDITHPKLMREMAKATPYATYCEVQQGSHYIHYENPKFLSDIVDCFIHNGFSFTTTHECVNIEQFNQA